MREQRCETCRFWDVLQRDDSDGIGFCQRYQPDRWGFQAMTTLSNWCVGWQAKGSVVDAVARSGHDVRLRLVEKIEQTGTLPCGTPMVRVDGWPTTTYRVAEPGEETPYVLLADVNLDDSQPGQLVPIGKPDQMNAR